MRLAAPIFLVTALALVGACSSVSSAMREPYSGTLLYRGGVEIAREEGIGGLSGLVVTADGGAFTALSDRGKYVTGLLRHDAAGRLMGVDALKVHDLGGTRSSRRRSADSESLTRLPDGGWLVSFEGDHRIAAYSAVGGLGSEPRRLAVPSEIARLPVNRGLEAVTVLGDGRVLAIAEARGEDGLHPGWIGREGRWRPFAYRSDPLFDPTDATVLPNGDILVLERHFSFLLGVRCRLVRLVASTLGDAIVEAVPVGDVAPEIGTDNFEGLAVRPADEGASVEIYVVSDDNFSGLQRTMLVQYALRIARPAR